MEECGCLWHVDFHSFISISVFLILGLLLVFGFVQYAHRKCVQHWCDEKGDITCEICHQVCFLYNSFHITLLFGYCKVMMMGNYMNVYFVCV